jgi:hypothetical protein
LCGRRAEHAGMIRKPHATRPVLAATDSLGLGVTPSAPVTGR